MNVLQVTLPEGQQFPIPVSWWVRSLFRSGVLFAHVNCCVRGSIHMSITERESTTNQRHNGTEVQFGEPIRFLFVCLFGVTNSFMEGGGGFMEGYL